MGSTSYNKKYYKQNKEKCKAQAKLWHANHRIESLKRMKKYGKKYYKKNKLKVALYSIKTKNRRNKIRRLKYKKNINYRLMVTLRSRLSYALHTNWKNKSAISLLGCSIDNLKKYLESQFKPGMTWDNHGNGHHGKGMQEWHIDHIKPCASFDLSKPEEQAKCFHYTNLQPLWAKLNLHKTKH